MMIHVVAKVEKELHVEQREKHCVGHWTNFVNHLKRKKKVGRN